MPKRILVVEDNDPLRELFRDTLTLRGFEVVVAANGSEALEAAKGYTIDAVITDLEIPGLSGLELCRALRRQTAVFGRHIPVWLMTGSNQTGLMQQALEAGACGLLRKPFSLDQACAQVERSLGLDSAVFAPNGPISVGSETG
jgi:two-component system, OmpR family, response regulator MtrA